MKTLRIALGGLLLAVASFAQVNGIAGLDPSLEQLLPPDAGLVMGLRWHKALASTTGTLLQKQIDQLEAAGMPEVPGLNDFARMMRDDVDTIYMAVPMGTLPSAGRDSPMLLVIKGRFDRAQTQSMFQGQSEIHRKVMLVTPPNMKPPTMRVAWLDENTILFGDRKEIIGALDRQAASAQPPASGLKLRSPRWLDHASDLAGAYDFWMILDAPPGGFKPSTPAKSAKSPNTATAFDPSAQMFSDLRGLDLGVSFSRGFQLQANLRAKSEQAGQSLATAMQGLMAMAAMQQQTPDSTQLLQKVRVLRSASTVSVSLALNEAEVKQVYAASQARNRTSTSGIGSNSGVTPGARPSVSVAPPPRPPRSGGIRILGQDSGTVEVPVGK